MHLESLVMSMGLGGPQEVMVALMFLGTVALCFLRRGAATKASTPQASSTQPAPGSPGAAEGSEDGDEDTPPWETDEAPAAKPATVPSRPRHLTLVSNHDPVPAAIGPPVDPSDRLRVQFEQCEAAFAAAQSSVKTALAESFDYQWPLRDGQTRPEKSKTTFRLPGKENGPLPLLDQCNAHMKAAKAALTDGMYDRAGSELAEAFSAAEAVVSLVNSVRDHKKYLEDKARAITEMLERLQGQASKLAGQVRALSAAETDQAQATLVSLAGLDLEYRGFLKRLRGIRDLYDNQYWIPGFEKMAQLDKDVHVCSKEKVRSADGPITRAEILVAKAEAGQNA